MFLDAPQLRTAHLGMPSLDHSFLELLTLHVRSRLVLPLGHLGPKDLVSLAKRTILQSPPVALVSLVSARLVPHKLVLIPSPDQLGPLGHMVLQALLQLVRRRSWSLASQLHVLPLQDSTALKVPHACLRQTSAPHRFLTMLVPNFQSSISSGFLS